MKEKQVTDLNSTDLAWRVAKELGVTYSQVDQVLKSLSTICSEYVKRGYSFALSDDLFFQVTPTGQKHVTSGKVLPTAVLHRALNERIGVSRPIAQGILDRCLSLMVTHYLLGASSYIYGLVSLNPSASLVYNRVTYGSLIKDARQRGEYRIRLVLSHRLRTAQFS